MSQIHYVNEDGNKVYVHGYDDRIHGYCKYEDVLLPMVWMVTVNDKLANIVTMKIRMGFALDALACPFTKWVTLITNGRPNIFDLLLCLYEEHLIQ